MSMFSLLGAVAELALAMLALAAGTVVVLGLVVVAGVRAAGSLAARADRRG